MFSLIVQNKRRDYEISNLFNVRKDEEEEDKLQYNKKKRHQSNLWKKKRSNSMGRRAYL